MLILDRQQDVGVQGRETRRGLSLRVRPNGPVINLQPGRTTIGSSPRCNVRIQQPGVQPLHCLIIREDQGVSVRRWAGETALNGHRLEESSLVAGDCLRVGPTELEIIGPESAAPIVEPVNVPVAPRVSDNRLGASRDMARARSRKLLATLRKDRSAARELELQVAQLQQRLEEAAGERERTIAELQNARLELTQARQCVAEHRDAIQARESLAMENRQLNSEIGKLTVRLDTLTGEKSEWDAVRQTFLDEKCMLDDKRQQLLDENTRLGEQVNLLTNQSASLTHERNELRRHGKQLQANLQALAEQQQQLTAENLQFKERTEQLASDTELLIVERDELRQHSEQLQADLQALAEQRKQLTEENSLLKERTEQLTNELTALTHERDEFRQHSEQLQANLQVLAEQRKQLTDENSLLKERTEQLTDETELLIDERDELRRHAAQLQVNLQGLTERQQELTDENCQVKERIEQLTDQTASLTCDRDGLRQQAEHLEGNLQLLTEEKAALVQEQLKLEKECDRLRLEASRLAELEKQVCDAVADRENTSSELYRALLQLAEMQERDDHNAALSAAHQALNDELEKSMDEVAQLQEQLDRLATECAAADGARESLAEQASKLNEAQQQLADENTVLAAELAETRTQLDEAHQLQAEASRQLATAESWRQELQEAEAAKAALADNINRLQHELAGMQQAEAETAAVVAEFEQQIAKYGRQSTELVDSVQRLERKLAAAEESERKFAQARDDWQRERTEAAQQLLEQSRQIAALESQLAEAAAAAKSAWKQSNAVASKPWRDETSDADDASDCSTSSAGVPEVAAVFGDQDRGAESSFDWSTMRDESQSFESQQTVDDADGVQPESPVSEFSWGRTQEDNGQVVAAETQREIGGTEEATGSWTTPDEFAGEETSQREAEQPRATQAAAAWDQPSEELSSASVVSEPHERSMATPPSLDSTSPRQSNSYIERYSHMFVDDESSNGPSAVPTTGTPNLDSCSTHKPPVSAAVSSNAAMQSGTEADEESIEQYMAKLLQRVRGDAPASATPQAQPPRDGSRTSVVGNNAIMSQPSPTRAAAATGPLESFSPVEGPLESISNFTSRRKATMPTPQTDLEALRALANESARRAISRHALRKHRRNALTKVIVSMLAGVTSLWLMLESPSWRDIQFITACLSMLVAAYWAGETFRTLLESLRIAAHDGPEDDIEDASAELRLPLPIDVENARPWAEIDSGTAN
jgi:DNA repair exonuclease SbcCD ATPase subunit